MPDPISQTSFSGERTIDTVIRELDAIIADCRKQHDPLGYFAVLYRRVTIRVRDGIRAGEFADNARMERLDILFADRYLNAYHAWGRGEVITRSWLVAFERSRWYWPIVLQHLLLGMNAHINLDLGIAAAEVAKGADLEDLRTDFNRINTILTELTEEVQVGLAEIWPTLHRILRWSGRADNVLTDFSMKIARDGAWRFARKWHHAAPDQREHLLAERDQRVEHKANLITGNNMMLRIACILIRLGERGSIANRMEKLAGTFE